MPVILQVHELDIGMRLANPVIRDRNILLPAGKVLNDADIDTLRRSCPRAAIHISDPVLDDLVSFQDVTRDRKVAAATRRKLLRAMSSVRDKFSSRMALGGMDLRGVHEAMAYITHYLNENPNAAAMIMRPGKEASYLTEHPANVFYLSVVVGNAVRNFVRRDLGNRSSLRSYQRPRPPINVAPLGLAALFMDVAMWPLEEAFNQPGPLSPEQREIVWHHPHAGAEVLPTNVPLLVGEIVRRHHENYDGTGYPDGLSADQIPLFARIVRLADAFDAATTTRVFRQAKSPPRVLWEMTMGPYAHLYDPVLLKIFGGVVQPFPIGAKLRLACGRYAVVVRFGGNYALLPEVIIAFDENGKRLPRERLEGPFKLEEHPALRIVSYGGEDLTDVYGEGTSYTEFQMPVAAEFQTLFESVYP